MSKPWTQRVSERNKLTVVEESSGYIHLKLTVLRTSREDTLNFSGAPNGVDIELDVEGVQLVIVSDLGLQNTLTLNLNGTVSTNLIVDLNLEESVLGNVEVDVRGGRCEIAAMNEKSSLVLLGGSLAIAEGTKFHVVSMRSGALRGALGESLHICGGTLDDPLNLERVDAKKTTVHGSCFATFNPVSRNYYRDLHGYGKKATLTLVRKGKSDASLLGSFEWIANIYLKSAGSGQYVEVRDSMSECKIEDGLGVTALPKARLENVDFPPPSLGGTLSSLTMGARSQGYGVSGSVFLRGAKEAHLSGDIKNGLLIGDTGVPRGSDSELDPARAFQGLVLQNFKLPAGLDGMSVLSSLEYADHLSPHLKGLTGWGLSTTGHLRDRESYRTGDPARVRQHADMMMKLSRLTHSKGASGEVRIRVGWCAHALRHKTTRPLSLEWVTLWGYRMLGFGERPVPAFLTWLLLTVIATVALIMLGEGKQYSFSNFIPVYMNEAISPLGTFVGTGGTEVLGEAGSPTPSWQYLLRALTAVPLVVGLLSLRKYAKAA